MSIEFFFRIGGLIVLALLGAQGGTQLAIQLDESVPLYASTFGLMGALAGLILTPWLTTRPIGLMREHIRRLPAPQLIAGVLGLILGLVVALLFSFPLSMLPRPLSQILPLVSAALFAYLGIMVMITRQDDIAHLINQRFPKLGSELEQADAVQHYVLLDTSVIIDGRIADICTAGFISGTLLVPQFVLNELQHIADSSDVLRRARGRRGLEILNRLQKESETPVRITEMDVGSVREVDDKLVALGKQLHCPILTNDYNLNRVAELQGVRVLNVNELANAVKVVLLPGESLEVRIIQEGKELGQGVGYLDDGTMIVVEDGERHMNRVVNTIVTKVLQTAAGRMIFAKPEE
jgi:uncharacterized protein YacL